MLEADNSEGTVIVSDLKKRLYENIATIKRVTAANIPLFFVSISILFKPICVDRYLIIIQTGLACLERDRLDIHNSQTLFYIGKQAREVFVV